MDKVHPDLENLKTSIETLSQDPQNLRLHDKRSIQAVTNSLDRFGQRVPIVVRNGIVIAGNARLQAAINLGWDQIAVVSADEDDDATAKLFAITDNRTADLSEFDTAGLAEAMVSLDLDDLGPLGWNDEELNELLKVEIDLGDLDEKPEPPVLEPPVDPVTNLGDLIILGDHRLLCGDSTKADDIAKLMDGQTADAIFTDPPYAMWGSSSGLAADIADDKMVRSFFRDIYVAIFNNLKTFGHAYICCDWRSWGSWWEVGKDSGMVSKNMVIWDKKAPGIGGMFQNSHELLMFTVKQPPKKHMTGKEDRGHRIVSGSNIWRVSKVNAAGAEGREHNAQKPLQLVMNALNASTDPGELVVDFFAGSGTTLIACENAHRRCYSMEIDPAYCDVIVRRYEQSTGKKAVRP